MNKSYSGPATLVVGGDVTVPVEADLHLDGGSRIRSWRGSLTADEDLGLLFDAGRRRLPDGGEGDVVAQFTQLGSDRVEVVGSGPPPWRDSP